MTRETRIEVLLYLVITLSISCGIMFAYAYGPSFMAQHFGRLGPGAFMYVLMTAAANLTALGLTLWKEGFRGCANLLIRTFDPRGPIKWWAIVLLGYPFLLLVYELISELFTLTLGVGTPGLQLERWFVGIPLFFYTFGPGRTGPLLEDAGWRGYLLPRLLESMSPLGAAIVGGVFWGLLHMPLFLALPGGYRGAPGTIVLTTVFHSIAMTWVFMNTSGNVFLSGVLVHAISNAAGQAGFPGDMRLVIFGLTAFALIWRYGEALRPAGAARFVHRRHYRLVPRPTDSGLP